MAPIETENNAQTKFWSDQQSVLWYVMVFSVVVNCSFDVLVAVAVVGSQALSLSGCLIGAVTGSSSCLY